MEEKLCPLCGYSCPSVLKTLSHLRVLHSSDPRFCVTCGLGGCASSFKTFTALYSHVYRRHPGTVKRRRVDTALEVEGGFIASQVVPDESVLAVNFEPTNTGKACYG